MTGGKSRGRRRKSAYQERIREGKITFRETRDVEPTPIHWQWRKRRTAFRSEAVML